MTTYFMSLFAIATSLLLFTSKTESSRVVTIRRPLVITQERKTPAYYLYQQAQLIQNPQRHEVPAAKTATTYLSSLSVLPPDPHIQISVMKFSKLEALQQIEAGYRNVASVGAQPPLSTRIQNEINNLAYESVIAPAQTPAPVVQNGEATSLSPSKKWATIRGKLELVDGVGIVDHQIQIRRIDEGQVREAGVIDLNAGTYSIDIASPQGYLIAQIKDKSGLVIGEDRERLVNLLSRGNYFEGPFMKVGQPETMAANVSQGGASATVASASLAGKAGAFSKSAAPVFGSGVSVTLFDNQTTLEKASDALGNVSAFSSTISRVFDPSRIYRNVTSIRHTGDKSETALFTSKWVDGVLSYISDAQKIEFKSKSGPLLIGRVLVDGKPVANAQVQIENAPGVSAVYLDQFMIPSLALNATSENGYFLFLGLESNAYTVVATRENLTLGSQLFVAEDDAIAFQNIKSLSVPRTKTLRSFDAFTSQPIATDTVSSETEDVIEAAAGTAVFQSRSEASVSEYISRSSDRNYLPVRYVQNSRQDYVHIPLVSEAWLNGLRAARQINELPSTGVLIGFTRELDYDAYLVSEDYNGANIVYFDSSGFRAAGPVAGGGFVLFNVPIGIREVILQERITDRIYSQVFSVLSGQVSVAHFSAE